MTATLAEVDALHRRVFARILIAGSQQIVKEMKAS